MKLPALSALDRKLARDLWKAKGQALAIALIVACGVGILVMSLGTLDSLKASRDAYYEKNRFADVFAVVKRAPRSLEARIAALPGVNAVETRIVRDVTVDIEGLIEPAAARLVSLPEHEPVLNVVTLITGRLPDDDRENEAVVSEAFAEANGFVPGDTLAALMNGVRREIVIVGVGLSPELTYLLAPGGLMPDNRRYGALWMNREALEAAFDLDGAFNELSIRLARGASEESVIDPLDRLLDPYGGLGAYGRMDHQSHEFLDGEMEQLSTIAGIIPPIFLVVAAYLLHSVLARLIDVEREQIGVLKAFGYTNAEVSLHYLKLALAIAAVGLLLGYALGMWLEGLMTDLYMRFYRFPSLDHRPSAAAFAAGALIALGSAVVGALSGVGRAARLAPAAAISPEPPPAFRSMFGRWGPFARLDASSLFDGPTRMILRHVMRWPGRAGATVAGVAAATGLLIATLFSLDSTEFLIDVAFERTASYDAALGFVEIRPIAALEEIARMPGVLAVEPSRNLPARLRFGSREENAGVIGVDPEGTMRRILDADLEDFVVPSDGIVLSSQMAAQLGASRGDRITLEALEGRRPVAEIYVSAVNEDFLGAPSYMDRRAINRLMREGEVVQGAYLRLDPDAAGDFYAAVKARPVIGVVTLQAVALQMFRDTIAESQNIMMTIYQALSGAIAAGVVYNSVRIALSERARELASMRVLGFGRLEVSYILLGQSLLLVLIALPLGCLFGYGLAALIASAMETELYRIPVVIEPSSYGRAVLVVLGAAAVSALIVRRQIDRLDLIAVLKTRD